MPDEVGAVGSQATQSEAAGAWCARGQYEQARAVEREFGRLKNEWSLAPLRMRGIERVRLHADLTIPAKLSIALARGAPQVAAAA